MNSYKDIKSQYLKNKIKNLSWEKRDYFDDLMTLEQWILGEISGWATAMMVHGLKGKYEIDYLEILQELRPKRFEELLKKKLEEDEKRAIDMEKEWITEKKRRERLMKEWLEMGGKL